MTEKASGAGTDPRRVRPGFATRLIIAQTLVLVAGAMTSWLVASAVGPGTFHDHLQRGGVAQTSAETTHVEEAFASALIVSLLVAVLASVLKALAVTWYFTRRVQRSITAVADSASEIATGRYSSRVPSPGLGSEFDQLAATFNQLAERLDTVSRAEEGTLHLVPTDPGDLIEAASRAAHDRYRAKGVALVEDVVAVAAVSVDRERMGQVFGNLLDNALRHTPRSGTVTLACRSIDSKWVEFIVRDSGEGIEQEHLTHVFDRFYRVDSARNRQRGGSGIGLTITRALVEAHHGGISVDSPGPGRGATFHSAPPGRRSLGTLVPAIFRES